MQLVLVAHRGGAALHIAHISPFVSHDQRTLKLSRVSRIDTEIGGELQGAMHPFGDIAERAVAEHSRIQGGEEVVGVRHHLAEVFPHQVGMLLDRLAERHEDDAMLGEGLLKRRLHRSAVHDGIHRHAGELLLLVERDAQLVESGQQLGIHLVQALLFLALTRSGIIDNILIINLRQIKMAPIRLLQRQPMTERLQTKLQQPLRFFLLGGNQPDDVFIQPFGHKIGLNVGHKTKLVILVSDLIDNVFLWI